MHNIHHANRDRIITLLREELMGPSPTGEAIDCTQSINLKEPGDYYRPHVQAESGEEIVGRNTPSSRYGIGVLFPFNTDADTIAESSEDAASDDEQANVAGDDIEPLIPNTPQHKNDSMRSDDMDDDFDISLTNAKKASSIGVSFLAIVPNHGKLVVEVSGGRYKRKDVISPDKADPRGWWLRSPVSIQATFQLENSSAKSIHRLSDPAIVAENLDGLDIRIEAIARQSETKDEQLMTVCVVNRTKSTGQHMDERCLFQTFFRVNLIGPDGEDENILPYPTNHVDLSGEDASLTLLYRDIPTFAVGHGCAADWKRSLDGKRATEISAEVLPVVETPSITPDIYVDDDHKQKIEISMAALAGLVDGDDGLSQIDDLIDRYSVWIKDRRLAISLLDDAYHMAANQHLQNLDRSLQRMTNGLAYLRSNEQAYHSFKLANHAVLLQQVRSRTEPRTASIDPKTQSIIFSEQYDPEELTKAGRGHWRPFQIAFLLSSLQSTAEEDAEERETVELIWFPTGGGKTEAYLGLTAFTIFLRRLRNNEDIGVQVLMRYTLRLLTAQQFQRASGLICAMEYLRQKSGQALGATPFSIGIWLGSATTPNSRDAALDIFRKLDRGQQCENKFVVTQCPWCGAQIGPFRNNDEKRKNKPPHILGYKQLNKSVVFHCSDRRCFFRDYLPVYVIDEDIYEKRPSMLIGTVDKFAMLTWKPEARSLFGIDADGERRWSPPGLIIQDELHLISGPLGSVVGLYEAVIEELCTDRRGLIASKPKIISSTATIRGYEEQVRSLYARNDVALFPPPGLDADDSFFARYARNPDGSLCSGRCYVGIHATGLSSLQEAQVRVFTTLLQAPTSWTPEESDPWWTLLTFFNSLRELGTTLTLFQSRIPDYQGAWESRMGERKRFFVGKYSVNPIPSKTYCVHNITFLPIRQ